MQELRMCKHISYEYFHEELFLVKHKSKYSCEKAIFPDLPKSIIESNCRFHYDFITTLTPNILDWGSKIKLVNIFNQKRLIWSKNFNLAKLLSSHDFVMVNRSILYHCEIESVLTCVLCSIGSCAETSQPDPIYFTMNMAFIYFFVYAWNDSKIAQLSKGLL